MSRPKAGYRVAGKHVPGVTSITSLFGDKGGLIHWAWKAGFNGHNYKELAKDAASIGKRLHELVDLYPEKLPEGYTPPRDLFHGYQEYLDWRRAKGLQSIAREGSIVSERRLFGGTPDEIALNADAQPGVMDWKSGRLYADQLFQLGGYKVLWDESPSAEEHGPIKWGMLCRFSPQTGNTVVAYIPDIDFAAEGFKHILEAYKALQIAKDII